ncbi:MAG: glutathione S-transferase N-terminal domain-containing protein [Bacteriovorax sp.]|nr:glutathione S-transferase N-terminal domain-containing protein [Bacteriovorax sp.]
MKAPILELYFFESCPYCQRVLTVIKELKVVVAYKNIHDDINEMQKLLYITGKKTVPCLFINGDPMHESLDIINWLKSNIESLDKTL